jgi:UDP-2-acetamido-2,6-beta-L-arabino-hexul-4-ose reductase
MKVLITGANGFIGKNLTSNLREIKDLEIITYDINDSFDKIEKNINDIDFVFHLAGVNRPVNVDDFYKGNSDLTKQLIDLLSNTKKNIPLLITSSIQAIKDNDYGKSKKMAEDSVLEYGKNNDVYIYRLHNVFGKWCRPNYNSVIATFCNNVANDLEISVNDYNAELELIYIDDICKEFISILNGNNPVNKQGDYCYIEPVYKKKLGEIADLIKAFKNNMESINVPKTGDDFVKKLFSTYITYVNINNMSVTAHMNMDDRGSFTELLKTDDSGQFSVSVSKPGIIRGNHYHHTKMERFIVVKGKAKISFRKIDEENITNYNVSDEKIEIVTICPGYTHKIENVGSDEMILLLWCNEIFDPKYPDTYYMEV